MRKPENLTLYYIFLAVGCSAVGVITTFAVLIYCEYYGIEISRNLWVLAIPLVFSLFLNISFIELYRWLRNRYVLPITAREASVPSVPS